MSFLNPLFLLGLAAVSMPILVHLVRRTRAPRVEFPSLMFVRRIPQRTIRRRRLHNLLLSASVTLRSSSSLLSRDPTSASVFFRGHWTTNVVLVDNSFSMRTAILRCAPARRTVVDDAGKYQAASAPACEEASAENRTGSGSAIDGRRWDIAGPTMGGPGAERILDATDLTGRRVLLISTPGD